MTQVVDGSEPLLAAGRQHGAPWPLVERRGQPRGGDAATARIPLQRQVREDSVPSSTWRQGLRRVALGVDVAAGMAGAAVVVGTASVGAGTAALLAVVLPLAWLGLLEAERAYEPRCLASGGAELRHVLDAGCLAAVVVVLVPTVAGASHISTGPLLALLLTTGTSLVGRAVAGKGVAALRARGRCRARVLLVGPHQAVQDLAALLAAHPEDGVEVVGCCLPTTHGAVAAVAGVPVMGDFDEVAPIVWRGGVDVVTVASAPETSGPALRKITWTLEGSGAEVLVAPGVVELEGPRLQVRRLTGVPLLHLGEPEFRGFRRLVKSAVERSCAAVVLVALLPLLVVIGLVISLDTRGPALFRQVRVGQAGRRFVLLKFRTMHVDAEQRRAELAAQNAHSDGALFKIKDDPRVTRVGAFLRRTSLDELPQLCHVVTGKMSLVGPRPALPAEVQSHDETVSRRQLVRPGLTGLWQVSGRSDLTWEQSVLLDLRYVENWSLGLDLRIVGRTILAVLRGRGAY